MRYILFSIIIICLLNTSDRNISQNQPGYVDPPDSLITVSFSVVGDIMCHSVQYNYARVSADSFDFNPVFSEIQKYLDQSDFLFGNLETVTAGEKAGYSGYPFFNTPDAFVRSIQFAGFDLLSTANNHAIDRGEAGIIRTIQQIKLNHLNYNGTFLSERDRDSIRIFNVRGIKTAFLAYTYGTNGNPVPKGKEYLVNIIDTIKIRNDIEAARKKGTDIVIVHFHFGEEYQRLPDSYQKTIVDQTVRDGADIIIGGHTHVLQPISFFKTNNAGIDSGFIIYSMGNFISNQRWRYSDGGAILSFSITKNTVNNSIRLAGVNYLPIWVFKGNTVSGRQYIIIPAQAAFSDSLFSFMGYEDRKLAAQSFHDTKEILTKFSTKPALRSILPEILSGTEYLSFH